MCANVGVYCDASKKYTQFYVSPHILDAHILLGLYVLCTCNQLKIKIFITKMLSLFVRGVSQRERERENKKGFLWFLSDRN